MMTDRIATRAEVKRFVVFGGSAELDSDAWAAQRAAHLDEASCIGREGLIAEMMELCDQS